MSEPLKIEQRANVKFCFKLGKTATETFQMIKTAYGDEAMSRSQVFQWFARFRDGQEEITDNARPGRPAISRNPEMVAKVDELMKSDRRLTLRKMEEKLGINKETIRIILEQDLGLVGPVFISSSHDEESLPLAADDYLDESTSSPSGARRARKRRTVAFLQNTIPQHRNPVELPHLIRPSPQPSMSTYHQTSVASEPPLWRARSSEPASLPVEEIKMEPVGIDISNYSVDDGFHVYKTYDRASDRSESGRRHDEKDGDRGGGQQEITDNISSDNKAIISGHDSDHMDFGNNNGINSETTERRRSFTEGGSDDHYSFTEGGSDDPSLSASDMNPLYPEVILNPGTDASPDSILGHL